MIRIGLGAFVAALVAPAAWAQDGDTELKRRILDRVREKLAADRTEILKRVERIIDEELSKEAPAPAPKAAPAPAPKAVPAPAPAAPLPPDLDRKVKDLERRLRVMDEQREALVTEIAKLRRQAEDETIKKEAQDEVPVEPEELKAMFDEGIKIHEKKKFAESTRLFKKIYYRFPQARIGAVSAYNVACGYALWGKKDEALDWLEISVKAGYSEADDFEHMRKDPDLDSLRDEKRYKKLLTDR